MSGSDQRSTLQASSENGTTLSWARPSRPAEGEGGTKGRTMTTEFTIVLEDRPGALAQLCTVLGDGRVNIEAIQGTSREGQAVVHVVADDPDRAARLLAAADISFRRREVLVVRVLDEPGMLGDVTLVMSRAGINIDSVYVTTRGHIVLGVDDLDGAIQVAGGMAVMPPE
jgi:hypothetical protein